ncbi:jg13640 [Pararge aegeria aegeria]|uniref:Jg13640 protein n=1 Tax=Pararge aegeria aegeria TaxID=348720 RepID=A0A8S4S8Q0_9NEOP|nr:jg13640 [Pararge aegeria aegeria]
MQRFDERENIEVYDDPNWFSDYSSSSSESDSEDAEQEDGEWSDISNLRQLPFTNAPSFNLTTIENPIDYFNQLFTKDFFETLVMSTNMHANAVSLERNTAQDHISRWVDTDVAEVKTFLALLFHIGHIKAYSCNIYWSSSLMFDQPFTKFMSQERFSIIMRYLCYTNEDVFSNETVFSTQPIIDYFNKRMNELVVPVRYLTIDESLDLTRIKGKRDKHGIKLHALTDANGICMKIHMHSRVLDPAFSRRDQYGEVAMLLLENYLNKGYTVFVDRYYSSIEIAESLIVKSTYLTGLLRANRFRNLSLTKTSKVSMGSCPYKYNERQFCVANFNDEKHVLISTQHFDVEIRHRRRGTVLKPRMVVEYKKHMNALARKNQQLSYFSYYPETLHWYKKILVHIMQLLLQNAYNIYKAADKANKKKDFLYFRLNIAERLLSKTEGDPTELIEQPDESDSTLITMASGEIIHMISKLPKDNRGRTKRLPCALCLEKNQLRKIGMFYCPTCPQQPGLCIACFREFHNY